MRALVLALAAPLAALAIASPAQAQKADRGFAARSDGSNLDPGFPDWRDSRGGFDGRHDRRRHRRFGDSVVVGPLTWNEGWALYNNRTFESGSYNDWWHDRPDRAYPRWVWTNKNCERMWWSGGGWRC